MHRNYKISKETEDKVKLAKQYIECSSSIIQPNTNLFCWRNNSKSSGGNASSRPLLKPRFRKRKKKQ